MITSPKLEREIFMKEISIFQLGLVSNNKCQQSHMIGSYSVEQDLLILRTRRSSESHTFYKVLFSPAYRSPPLNIMTLFERNGLVLQFWRLRGAFVSSPLKSKSEMGKITIFDLDLQDHHWWSRSFGWSRSISNWSWSLGDLWSLIFKFQDHFYNPP